MTLRSGSGSMTLGDVVEDARPVARDAGNERIRVAVHDHQGGEDIALVQDEPLAVALQIAPPLQARVEEVRELVEVCADLRISMTSYSGRRTMPSARNCSRTISAVPIRIGWPKPCEK